MDNRDLALNMTRGQRRLQLWSIARCEDGLHELVAIYRSNYPDRPAPMVASGIIGAILDREFAPNEPPGAHWHNDGAFVLSRSRPE